MEDRRDGGEERKGSTSSTRLFYSTLSHRRLFFVFSSRRRLEGEDGEAKVKGEAWAQDKGGKEKLTGREGSEGVEAWCQALRAVRKTGEYGTRREAYGGGKET
jgi:hypothetical protein